MTITENSVGFVGKTVEEEAGDWVEALWKELCYQTGAPISEICLSRKDDGWLLRVKARSASKGGLISFFYGRTVKEAVDSTLYAATHTPGWKWTEDKYAKG